MLFHKTGLSIWVLLKFEIQQKADLLSPGAFSCSEIGGIKYESIESETGPIQGLPE